MASINTPNVSVDNLQDTSELASPTPSTKEVNVEGLPVSIPIPMPTNQRAMNTQFTSPAYPPSEDALKQARLDWRAAKQRWFDDYEERERAAAKQDPMRMMSNVEIRNFSFTLEDSLNYYRSRLEAVKTIRDFSRPLDLQVHVGPEELGSFWEECRPRLEAYITNFQKMPMSEWLKPIPLESWSEYRWCHSIETFIKEMVEEMLESADDITKRYHGDTSTTSTRVPPNGLLSGVPSDINSRRGASETAESRVRFWHAQKALGRPIAGAKAPATLGTLSAAASYKANFTTLGAISFVGASVSWSSLFSSARGDLVVLAWASTVFITAAVAAAGMGIIIESDSIDIDRDMGARRAVRAFSVTSATMILAGIILLSTAIAGVEPTYAISTAAPLPPSHSRRRAMQASGWFAICFVVLEVVLALVVRFRFSKGTYKL